MTMNTAIRVLIVDDEPLARHGLREVLESEKDIVIAGECGDGQEAIEMVQRIRPDVLFLDIQMPETDGFDVISALPAGDLPLVVFVTAYDEFALKAFTANALDYILKPYDAERIHSSLRRIREMLRLKQQAEYSERIRSVLSSFQQKDKFLQRIPIRHGGKISLVNVHDVVWIEAAADYINIHTAKEKHLTRGSIGEIEQQLDPALFVRIHRSSIINIKHIRELTTNHHGDYTALMDNGIELTVSRNYKDGLAHLIGA